MSTHKIYFHGEKKKKKKKKKKEIPIHCMFQLKKEPYLELWVSIIINRF